MQDEQGEQSERTVRVYDDNGDFVIVVPADAELTMQYFNPNRDEDGAFSSRPPRGARRTRLSVKVGKQQLAVFLGVNGFRDESIKLTRLKQRVVVERNYEDDGLGSVKFGASERRELVVSPEEGTYQ